MNTFVRSLFLCFSCFAGFQIAKVYRPASMEKVWALAMTPSECQRGCRERHQGFQHCDECEHIAPATLLVWRPPLPEADGKVFSVASFRAFMKGIVWGNLRQTLFDEVPGRLVRDFGYTGRPEVFQPKGAGRIVFSDLLWGDRERLCNPRFPDKQFLDDCTRERLPFYTLLRLGSGEGATYLSFDAVSEMNSPEPSDVTERGTHRWSDGGDGGPAPDDDDEFQPETPAQKAVARLARRCGSQFHDLWMRLIS